MAKASPGLKAKSYRKLTARVSGSFLRFQADLEKPGARLNRTPAARATNTFELVINDATAQR
jgi:hypothetical protein